MSGAIVVERENNMSKINYKDLIAEITEEVTEGTLTEGDSIQILRADKPVFQDYCPIIDWYYDAYVMKEELETSMEEMYMEEEFTKEEWKQMLAEQEEFKKQYQEDQDKLVTMKVKDVLTEMKQMQKLLGK